MAQGPVQPIPPGLLTVFGLKSNGNAPHLLSDEYQLSVDSLEWLLANDRSFVSGTGVLNPVFALSGSAASQCNAGVLSLPIPANEIWYLHNVSCFFTFAGTAFATTPGQLAIGGFVDATAPVNYFGVVQRPLLAPAGTSAMAGFEVRRWLPRRFVFCIAFDQLAVAAGQAFNWTLNAEVTRVQV